MTASARGIEFPVGRHGLNKSEDVRVIQQLLNEAIKRNKKLQSAGIKTLKIDGECGPFTIRAIQNYQEKALGWSGNRADATVHPAGKTWKSLNGNSPGEIKVANVTTRPRTIDGFAAFWQGDKAWGPEILGNGNKTIHQWGCAMCTLTMAATAIGSPTKFWPENLLPRDLTPSQTNTILRKAGAFSGSILDLQKAANALGMTYDEYGKRKDTTPEDVAIIDAHIRCGYPVAAHVDYKGSKGGDHWILMVTRYADGTFGAIDPAYGARLRLTSAPTTPSTGPIFKRVENITRGVLYGIGMGGSANQQQYVVVRFACLSPAVGAFCSSSYECYS